MMEKDTCSQTNNPYCSPHDTGVSEAVIAETQAGHRVCAVLMLGAGILISSLVGYWITIAGAWRDARSCIIAGCLMVVTFALPAFVLSKRRYSGLSRVFATAIVSAMIIIGIMIALGRE